MYKEQRQNKAIYRSKSIIHFMPCFKEELLRFSEGQIYKAALFNSKKMAIEKKKKL